MSFTNTALLNGETGYFFSDGRGQLGGQGIETKTMRAAAKNLCSVANKFIDKMQPTTAFPPVRFDHWQFFLMTPRAVLTATVPEETLMQGHELSGLYYSALELHEVWIDVLPQASSEAKGRSR
jgi:hypothetical protein